VLSRTLLSLLALSIAFLVACSRPAPVVSSPIEEWEADAERGRVAIPQPPPYPTPYKHPVDEVVLGEAEEKPGQTIEAALADIVGFPFRAAAWLARTIL